MIACEMTAGAFGGTRRVAVVAVVALLAMAILYAIFKRNRPTGSSRTRWSGVVKRRGLYLVTKCPDTHARTDEGGCQLRDTRLAAHGPMANMILDPAENNEPVRAETSRHGVYGGGLNNAGVRRLCKNFSGHPYVALTELGRECHAHPRPR